MSAAPGVPGLPTVPGTVSLVSAPADNRPSTAVASETVLSESAAGVAATDAAGQLRCPRCQGPLSPPFYGPCESCRAELRQQYTGLERAVEATEFIPKMNVTPNAVALKDD